MKNYKQLTAQQRYQIEALLQVGCTQTAIADQIGVHRSTISRELKRSIALRGTQPLEAMWPQMRSERQGTDISRSSKMCC